MRHHQNRLAAPQTRRQEVVPPGRHPRRRLLQAFAARQQGRIDRGVKRIAGRQARVVVRQCRRRGAEAAPPQGDLIVAVPERHLGPVMALKTAVVALVEAPAALHRQIRLMQFLEQDLQRPRGAAQIGRAGEIEAQIGRGQAAPGGAGLLLASGAERCVGPSRKAVLARPFRLAVSDQDQAGHVFPILST